MKAQPPRLAALGGLLAVLLSVVAVSPVAAQTPVYELPADEVLLSVFGFLMIEEDVEYAELAVLGGSERLMLDLMIPVYSDLERDATVTAMLYHRDPLGGGPAMPVWTDSRTLHFAGNLVDGGLTGVGFTGMNLLVPDEFYWSVRFNGVSDYDPAVEELSHFGPVLNSADNLLPVGAATDPEQFLLHRPGDPYWSTSVLGSGTDATISVTMTAVPEPGSVGMMLLGLASAWRRRGATHHPRRPRSHHGGTPSSAS